MDTKRALWDLANAVTAFAVLQALAFLYALGKPEMRNSMANEAACKVIVPAIVGASLLYAACVLAIGFCLVDAGAAAEKAWTWVSIGRALAILVFGAFALWVYLEITKT